MSPTATLAIILVILFLLILGIGKSVVPKQIAMKKKRNPIYARHIVKIMQPIVIENRQSEIYDLEEGQPLYRNRSIGGAYNGSYKTYTA